MIRDEQLNFCKICKNQKHSLSLGVICRLTNQIADFKGNCDSFEEDVDLVCRLNKIKSTGSVASQGKRLVTFSTFPFRPLLPPLAASQTNTSSQIETLKND